MKRALAALQHVQNRYPQVTKVTYSDEGGGFYQWSYQTENGDKPEFSSDEIDQDLLIAGLDAVVFDFGFILPATFTTALLEKYVADGWYQPEE